MAVNIPDPMADWDFPDAPAGGAAGGGPAGAGGAAGGGPGGAAAAAGGGLAGGGPADGAADVAMHHNTKQYTIVKSLPFLCVICSS